MVFVINENHEVVKAIRANTKSVSQAGRELLQEAAIDAAKGNSIVLGANLGNMLKKLDPSFSPMKYGFGNLTEFNEQYLDILTYEGMKSGGDKKYRLHSKDT